MADLFNDSSYLFVEQEGKFALKIKLPYFRE